MKHQIQTSITINATPEKVWEVFTDFSSYPEWNPFIKSIQGSLKLGEKISIKIKPPNGKELTFKPELLVLKINNELRWRGKFILKGVFDGEHYFVIDKLANGTVKFEQGELFSGLLVGVLKKTLIDTKQGFELMNAALKHKCENGN